MRDEPVRLALLGQLLARRWRLLAVLTVLGALAGAGASMLFSPGYETTASVLLQGPREPDELLTEAQVATSSVVLDRAGEALHEPVGELLDSVTAEVGDGNVINITVTADSPERAQQVADQVADDYARFSAQLVNTGADADAQVLAEQQDALRRQVAETNQRISELHAAAANETTSVESVQVRTQLEALRTGLANAITTLDESEAASRRATVVVMGAAARPVSPAPPTMPQLTGGGAALAFLLGVLGHLLGARADRRLRDGADVESAVGAPVLAGLDVPDTQAPTRSGLVRWFLGDGPWQDARRRAGWADLACEVRYRRLLARLRGAPGAALRLLVVVAEEDQLARQAVVRLAMAAAGDGTVSVRTNDPTVLDLVSELGEDLANDRRVAAGRDADPAAHTVLRVVPVSARRPAVSDDDTVAGALVVVTAAFRTGPELVDIACACTDAGHEVVGAVLTRPATPIDDDATTTPELVEVA